MDPYQPEPWHDFFLATAGAAAGLTGLLFVALSLHIRYIATERIYREMARGSLIGLVMAVVLSLLVLVQQSTTWLAVEFAVAGLLYLAGVAGEQLLSLRRTRWRIPAVSLVRSIAGYLLALVGLLTALGLPVGIGPGLYANAVIVVAVMLWSLWNAWVLVVGVADEEIAAEDTARRPSNPNS